MKEYTDQEFRNVINECAAEVTEMCIVLVEVVDIDNHFIETILKTIRAKLSICWKACVTLINGGV